jgi:carboxyl-terminal processing protease
MNENNQPEFKKSKKKYLLTIVFVIAIFSGGFFVGKGSSSLKSASITDIILNNSDTVSEADLGLFWKAWKIIDQKSPDAKKVGTNDRIYGAIKGLAASLGDPYTVFFTPSEQKSFQEQLKGSFAGVGMEIGIKDDILTVISPIKGTPAYKAGILAGDKIVSIDGITTQDLSVDDAVKKIRGEVGTKVKIEIFHEGAKKTEIKELTRATIVIENIEYSLRKDGVFVIKLFSFNDDSDIKFQQAITEFSKSNSNKLIIDLRNNPGGYLESAVNIASWFIKPGEVIVKEDYGGKQDSDVYTSKGYDLLKNKKFKTVVLINKGSASASEILTGALKEYGIATVIGETSFGKGSVQQVVPINEETSLKITIANWLTPNGVWISKQGITPDIIVKNTSSKVDTQFNKALEIVKKK